jgi:hypothetical protein
MKNNLLLIFILLASLIAIGYGTNEITKPKADSAFQAETRIDIDSSNKINETILPASDEEIKLAPETNQPL